MCGTLKGSVFVKQDTGCCRREAGSKESPIRGAPIPRVADKAEDRKHYDWSIRHQPNRIRQQSGHGRAGHEPASIGPPQRQAGIGIPGVAGCCPAPPAGNRRWGWPRRGKPGHPVEVRNCGSFVNEPFRHRADTALQSGARVRERVDTDKTGCRHKSRVQRGSSTGTAYRTPAFAALAAVVDRIATFSAIATTGANAANGPANSRLATVARSHVRKPGWRNGARSGRTLYGNGRGRDQEVAAAIPAADSTGANLPERRYRGEPSGAGNPPRRSRRRRPKWSPSTRPSTSAVATAGKPGCRGGGRRGSDL